MPTQWLADAKNQRDLSGFANNGPFQNLLGVILHVNVDEYGTPLGFWGPGNPSSVVPNVQVFKDGSFDQMLPLDRQPWCQIDGNFSYAAIETAGLPSEPLTPAQIATIARIMRIYHVEYGVPLQLANQPGDRGLGTHKMGGPSWGGHDCPGDIRTAQRADILAAAQSTPTPKDPPMSAAEVSQILAAVAELKTELDDVRARQQVFAIVEVWGDKNHPDSIHSLGLRIDRLVAKLGA